VNIGDWLPYSLPLIRPWQTSQGKISERQGRLFRLRSADGRIGWGDCAPFPEFGINDAAAQSFAEECAQLDLAAQAAGLPLNAFLSGNPAIGRIGVNAVLGSIATIDHEILQKTVADGFTVIKLKAGIREVDDEIAMLKRLATGLPTGIQLRLDANGAWDMAQARRFVERCSGLPVEVLEEPLINPSHAALAELQSMVEFPIAVDESVHLLDAQFFHHPPVRRLVLKPPRQGSLLSCVELGLRARASGIEPIVSSSLESACGVLACAQLAAAIAPTAIHGLATNQWFVLNTGTEPEIRHGHLTMPAKPGIGFTFAG